MVFKKELILILYVLSQYSIFSQNSLQSIGTEFKCSASCPIVYDLINWNGKLIASGKLNSFDGINDNDLTVVEWDGVRWNALGGAVFDNGSTKATILKMFGTDDALYICGKFENLGGDENFANIAKWDGCDWLSVGGGIDDGEVRDILITPNDEIIIGGSFKNAGGNLDADYIAKWDGNAWNAMRGPGGNDLAGNINALEYWNGEVYAGGHFNTETIPDNEGNDENFGVIAKWDGNSWFPLVEVDCNLNGQVHDLQMIGNNLYIGGDLRNGCYPNQYEYDIVSYDGSTIHDVGVNGVFSGLIEKIWEHNGAIYIGGSISDRLGENIDHMAFFDFPYWKADNGFVDGDVYAITSFDDQLIVGGKFFDLSETHGRVITIDHFTEQSFEPCGIYDQLINSIDQRVNEKNQGESRKNNTDFHFYEINYTVCNISQSNCSLESSWSFLKSDRIFQVPLQEDFTETRFFVDDLDFSGIQLVDCDIIDLPKPPLPEMAQKLGLFLMTIPSCPWETYNLMITDPVIIRVDESLLTITNYTLESHALYPGKVTRYLYQTACGDIKIRTIGQGFSNCNGISGVTIKNLNEDIGRKTFENISNRYIDRYLER